MVTNCHDRSDEQQWYDRKSALMAGILGVEHDEVMHAIVPYAIGGGLDLYYYPHGIPGTGIATKELCEAPGQGPSNRRLGAYELVMFTSHPLSLDDLHDESTPFGRAHASIRPILHCIARYSAQAQLNPRETCEFPADMDGLGGKCLIFDAYGAGWRRAAFGLLAVIEIHRTEMDYARRHGGKRLLKRLKKAGYYPYSDLDRPAVV